MDINLVALQGMFLASVEWDSARFRLVAVDLECSALYEALLSNEEQSPISVVVHWADFRMIRVADTGVYTFGEIEEVEFADGVVHIETDAGHFSVHAAKHFVQRLRR